MEILKYQYNQDIIEIAKANEIKGIKFHVITIPRYAQQETKIDQDQLRKEMKSISIYNRLIAAREIPQNISVHIFKEYEDEYNVRAHIKLTTTASKKIFLSISSDNFHWILYNDNLYRPNKYSRRESVTNYILEKALKGSLVVEDIAIPVEAFRTEFNRRIKNKLSKNYEKGLKKCVYYTQQDVSHPKERFLECFAIDISEVKK